MSAKASSRRDPAANPRAPAEASPKQAPREARALPLVIDLDGALLATDTVSEALVAGLKTRPLGVLKALAFAPFSRARKQASLAEAATPDFTLLPLQSDLAAHLAAEKLSGRKICLITHAHQSVADAAGDHFGVFDEVWGSGEKAFTAKAKAEFLAETFPDGFVYAGDSAADRAVWTAAEAGLFVGESRHGAKAFDRSGVTPEGIFARPVATLTDWAQQLRLHVWLYNLLVFAALFVGHAYFDPMGWANVAAGFAALCLVTSGTSLIGDLMTLDADRAGRASRHRPMVSGRIRPGRALVLGPALMLAGLAAAALLPLAFALLLGAFAAGQLAYAGVLRQRAFLDVFALGGFSTLRVAMGAALAGLVLSEWLLVAATFLFVSLAVAARHAELVRADGAPEHRLPGRGYQIRDRNLTGALGMATATAAIFALIQHLMDEALWAALYTAPAWLWSVPVLVALGLGRVWLAADRGLLLGDPVVCAVRDRACRSLFFAAATAFGLALIDWGVAWALVLEWHAAYQDWIAT